MGSVRAGNKAAVGLGALLASGKGAEKVNVKLWFGPMSGDARVVLDTCMVQFTYPLIFSYFATSPSVLKRTTQRQKHSEGRIQDTARSLRALSRTFTFPGA